MDRERKAQDFINPFQKIKEHPRHNYISTPYQVQQNIYHKLQPKSADFFGNLPFLFMDRIFLVYRSFYEILGKSLWQAQAESC